MGFETFNVGPELEYFLFKDDAGTETLDEGGYFAMTTMDAATDLRQDTVAALESMGIPIEYVHHEVGPSQHEIDMRFAPALDMADHTLTYRLIVKEIAKKAGYHATFMPKPIFGENGSGMHTHQSLFTDGRNAVLRRRRRVAPERGWEGVHRRAAAPRAEIAAVFAQWVNPYKRLVPGYEAPVYVAWSRRKPLGADPDPALQAGPRAGDARGDPVPRPRVQPVPDVRRAPARRARGDRAGYELPEPMEIEPLPPDSGAAARAGSSRYRRRSVRRSTSWRSRSSPEGARAAHLRPLRRAEAEGVGRVLASSSRAGS